MTTSPIHESDPARKILTLAQAQAWHAQLRAAGKSLAVTNGAFDLLHRGHATYLWQAAQQADALLVAINSDASVQASKGPDRPLVNENDRAYLVASLACVSAVVIFNGPKPVDVFTAIPPDVYVKGGDYTEDSLDREEHAILKQAGARFVFIPLVDGCSTTATVRRIREARPDQVRSDSPAAASATGLNPRLDFIFRRRSVRRYQLRPVADAMVSDLLQAGMAAPSARACDPWHFVILADDALRADLASKLPNGPFLADAPTAIVVCGDLQKANAQSESFLLVDCAAATQNILLAATALGLGACWLGIHPRPERIALLRQALNLPESIIPVAIITLGWPAEDHEPRTRAQSARIHRNTF